MTAVIAKGLKREGNESALLPDLCLMCQCAGICMVLKQKFRELHLTCIRDCHDSGHEDEIWFLIPSFILLEQLKDNFYS